MLHDYIFLLSYGGLERLFFLDILLSPSFLLLFLLSLYLLKTNPELIEVHLLKKTHTNILNFCFWPSSNILLKLSNFRYKLLLFFHLNSFLLFLFLQNPTTLLLSLIMNLFILLDYLFPFNSNIFLYLLNLLNHLLFVQQYLLFELFTFLPKFIGNLFHITDHILLLLNIFDVSLHGSLSCQFHLNFSSLLKLQLLIFIFLFHLLLPVFKFRLIAHVYFEIFHPLLFLLNFLIQLFLLS